MIKRNLLYSSLLSVSQILFPLIIFPYTFKILKPEGTGLVGFVESLTQYLISLAAIGIPIYGVREVAKCRKDPEKLDKIFTELLVIQFISTLFIASIYIVLIFWVEKFSSHKLIYFLSCIVLLVNLFSVEWFFQGMEQFKYITIRTILIRTLFLLLIICFVKEKEDATVYYGVTFVTTVISSGLNFYYAHKFVRLNFKRLHLKRHFQPLLHIFFALVAINIYVVLDTVILGFLSTNEAVGYYTMASKICKLPLAFITALSTVMIPQFSAAHLAGKQDYIQAIAQKSFTYVIFFSVPVGVGLCLLAPQLILLLGDENFLPAASLIRMLAVLTLLIGLSNVFGIQMLTSMGKEKLMMYAAAIGMILSLTLNFILIPLYSYKGTAITVLIIEFVIMLLTAGYAIRIFKIRLPLNIFFQALAASLIFFPIYFFIEKVEAGVLVRTMLMIVMSAIFYFTILAFIFKNVLLKDVFSKVLLKFGYGRV